jgi:hypothetical protein
MLMKQSTPSLIEKAEAISTSTPIPSLWFHPSPAILRQGLGKAGGFRKTLDLISETKELLL